MKALSDSPYWTLSDALADDRGKVAAAEVLGDELPRTMAACHECRQVSRGMRRTLKDYRGATVDGGSEQDDEAGGMAEELASLGPLVIALKDEHGTTGRLSMVKRIS